jgi:hypothetical protein
MPTPVALFVRCAAAAGAFLDVSDAKVRADVIAICRQTGGLPLAIELAAARTTTLPTGYIARTLWRHIGTSRQADPAGAPSRRSLTEALEWAHDLLAKSAQEALPQVAVFEGRSTRRGVRRRGAVRAWRRRVRRIDRARRCAPARLRLRARSAAPRCPNSSGPSPVGGWTVARSTRSTATRYFPIAAGPAATSLAQWADVAAAVDHEIRRGRWTAR